MKYNTMFTECDAVSFTGLREHGKRNAGSFTNGLPMSFTYCGMMVTHMTQTSYMVTDPKQPSIKPLMVRSGEVLVVTNKGSFVCDSSVFINLFGVNDEELVS